MLAFDLKRVCICWGVTSAKCRQACVKPCVKQLGRQRNHFVTRGYKVKGLGLIFVFLKAIYAKIYRSIL